MTESGNIFKKDYGNQHMPQDSVSRMYIELIGRLQEKYDRLYEAYSNIQQELEKERGKNEILAKQNDGLIHEVRNLTTSIELEKAKNVSSRHLRPLTDTESGYADTTIETSTPSATRRRYTPRPIDKMTVDRLRCDRRYYAIACDKALHFWQILANEGFVDEHLRLMPKSSVTVAARIACCFQTEVDPAIKWSFFEKHWDLKHLQSSLSRTTYKDEKKYIIINRIFCRPDDAPFLAKGKITD